LISKGRLIWNVGNDLCGQTGVICDTSNPKRVIQLYSFFSYFFFQNFGMDFLLIKNRGLTNQGLSGTILTEFGSLVKLLNL